MKPLLFPYFIDKENKYQGGYIAFPGPQSQSVAGLIFKPRPLICNPRNSQDSKTVEGASDIISKILESSMGKMLRWITSLYGCGIEE